MVDRKPEESSVPEGCIPGGKRYCECHRAVRRTAVSDLWASVISSRVVTDEMLKLLKQNSESE